MSLEPVNVPVAGGRKVNLILVANRQVNQEGDFWKVARFVREMCSDVEPVVVVDGRHRLRKHWWGRRASMVFSAVPMKKFAAVRGRVYQGSGLGKADEYRALERAGVAVPRWRLLTEAEPRPDVTGFGPYVVVKPDRGGRGAMVKIVKSTRAKWEPAETRIAGESDALVAQEFIYTGQWPVSYRVTTLFGEALWSLRQEADRARTPLAGPEGFKGAGGVTIVSNSKGCQMSLNFDREVIEFAERAHAALPDVPLLGVDVIRDAVSGKLYVVELNSSGWVWHFSSPLGLRAQKEFGFSLEGQFDGLRKAAGVLVRKARDVSQ